MGALKRKKDNGKKTNRLQLRISLGVTILTLVFFLSATCIIMNMITGYVENQIKETYQTHADEIAQEVTTWFTNESQIVANQKAVIEINGEFDKEQLTNYLKHIVDDYNDEGYIYDLYFVSTKNEMSSGYGYIPEASIDFRQRQWYVGAYESEGLYFSTPYKDTNLDKYVVTISTKVYDSNRNFRGVLALDIFVDTLFDIVEKKELPENSYCFLVDSDLGIATHPNKEYGYVNEEPLKIQNIPDNIYNKIYLGLTGQKADNVSVESDYDGKYRNVYIGKVDCCDWYVTVMIWRDLVYIPLIKMLEAIFAVLVICLIIGVFLAKLATGRIIKELKDAKDAADVANETKSVFLANMSHEIRTPINAVIGMNEMILRENKNPEIHQYALDIASASRSLTSIINDILDFSKIESGKIEIIESEFNIASIINDVVNMSVSRLGGKKLELIFNISPDVPVGIIGDEMRIRQIIINLMTNGIKYTRKGFVCMHVSCSKQEYGINLDVSVKDSGIGIKPEDVERLFDSFMQLDTKKNRSIEGTGLGLAISKRLVKNMGGFINVSSEYGIGSEFKISIPLKCTDEKPFISIDKPEELYVLCLFDFSNLGMRTADESIRNLYDMAESLNINMKVVCSVSELKRLVEQDCVTHIFVDKDLFVDSREYFESISKELVVTVVQDRQDTTYLSGNIRYIHKPFYVMALASIINNEQYDYGFNENKDSINGFVAPEAKILVVDDNSVNLKVAVGLMKPYQMQVSTCDSAKKAIELIDENQDFNLVFMDHMMPEMDGVEATKILREKATDYYKNLKIVALTANAVNDSRSMFLQSGFDDFLAKPIDVSSLERILKKNLPKKLRLKKETDIKQHKENNLHSESIVESKQEEVVSQEEVINTIEPDKEKNMVKLLDPTKGIKYTGDDEGLYIEVLSEYLRGSQSSYDFIDDCFKKKDWKNYIVKVHALKSSSLSIGAEKLSEMAKKNELAGKAGNYEVIEEGHEEMMQTYSAVISQGREYLAEKGIEL